jgi:heme-degrading monooxygenase HmoA
MTLRQTRKSCPDIHFSGEAAMHTVIRTYQGVQDSAEVARRASEEFGPSLRDLPGFLGYWVVDGGDGVLATITFFETEEASAEANAASATWVQENLANLVPNPPRVTSGETIAVTAEAPV